MVTEWKQFVNNAGSELTATLTNTATSFSVPTGEGGLFPESGPFWVTIFGTTVAEGHEIILVGTISGDTFSNCSRGQQGTSAAQWPAGSNVQLLWTAGSVEQIQAAITALEEGTVLTDLAFTQDVQVRKAGTSVTPKVTLIHSRGSISSPTATQSADAVGSVLWQAFSSALAPISIAEIVALPDGQIPASGDAPGMLEFRVTPNGSATPVVALTLYNDKSATAGALENQIWDSQGYIPLSAIKTGTTNNSKVMTAGETEGSAGWASLESNLPATEGQEGKFLGCGAEGAIWTDVPSDLPDMTGNTGKFLTTDGSDASWGDITFPEEIPDQTGNTGKFLTTDGSNLSWGTPDAGDALPDQTGNDGKFLTTNGTVASWGTPTAVPGANSVGASELKEDDSAIQFLALALVGATTGDANVLSLKTSRGSVGSPSNSGSGDGLGIDWNFYYSSAYRKAAEIKVEVDGTLGTGDYPSRMEFRVTKDGTSSPYTDANLVIKNSGYVGIGETSPGAQLHVRQVSSSGAVEVLYLEQSDQDEPFIHFQGTSAADETKSLSTQAIESFTYAGMVRVNVNNTDVWMPYYAAT